MPQKARKLQAEQERLKTLAMQEEVTRKRARKRYNRAFYAVAVLWAVLAALPSLYIGRPLQFMVGSTAPQNVYSRVDFTWHDAAAENQALKNLESSFARRYREESPSLWAAETHGPIDQFLVRAAAAGDMAEAGQAARDLGLTLSPAQLISLWRGTTVAKNDPFHYLVTPLKEVLDNEIFTQGVLDDPRFELERGRTIQIIRGDAAMSAMVGGERGPTSKTNVNNILERRFRVKLSGWLSDEFKNALRELVMSRLKPNLVYDESASHAGLEERREELLARVQTVKKNDMLIARGERVALDKLAKLREEENAYRESQGWRLPVTRFAGNFLLFVAISISMVIYFRTAEKSRTGGPIKRFLVTAVLCLAPIFAGYWLVYMGFPGTMLPIGLIIGIVALGTTPRTAVFVAAISSLSGLILFEGRADLMIGFLTAGLFFISTAPRCRRRFALLMVSLAAGLIGAIAFIAWNLARGDMQNIASVLTSWSQALDESRAPLIAALGLLMNWLWCGVLILLLLPFIERFFGVTTRIRLQDLSGQEHPILKRLILEAPGTYHHSSIVSTLAEAAANAIGADGLKARIGGQYHDIGKLMKPEYFTENEAGISRHANMTPNMSALLIINHVRDGAEMAASFKLPSAIIDMITQHHGDSLMKYFYHKAQLQAPPGSVVPRETFLYPGPKPQSPEAGVLMIADSVEAAVRSLDQPSPQHMRTLIDRLIQERLTDGEFEESGLTMSQLARVGDVLFRMLTSMYHTRVKYPGQEKEKRGRKR